MIRQTIHKASAIQKIDIQVTGLHVHESNTVDNANNHT